MDPGRPSHGSRSDVDAGRSDAGNSNNNDAVTVASPRLIPAPGKQKYKPIPPAAYAQTLSAYASRTVEKSFFPARHLERLAGYILDGSNKRHYVAPPSPSASQPFVFAYHYANLADGLPPTELTSPTSLLPAVPASPVPGSPAPVTPGPLSPASLAPGPLSPGPPSPSIATSSPVPSLSGARGQTSENEAPTIVGPPTTPGTLIFLRGLPSAEWLAMLGGTYHVDPEFFHRHLEFFSTAGRINYFPPAALPSSSSYIVELRYVTLTNPTLIDNLTPALVQSLRADARNEMTEYLGTLSKCLDEDHPQTVGDSIVRSFAIFESGHVAIEQAISVCVTHTEDRWTALAWIDTGKDLSTLRCGPWRKHLQTKPMDQRSFLPTIQIRPLAALRAHGPSYEIPVDKQPPPKFAQSAALLHLEYGRTLDGSLMANDAFYAFDELFRFCASSLAQYLSVMELNISEEATTHLSNPQELARAQAKLMYIQGLLEDLTPRLRANVDSTKARGSPFWPRASAAPSPNAKGAAGAAASRDGVARAAAETLRKDYEFLLHRAGVLSERIKSQIGHLTTKAMLAESQRAILQAEEVTNLTRLAFIFVPLSFTTSLFGMNLRPFVDEQFHLWLWVTVSVPLLLVSALFMRKAIMVGVKKGWENAKKGRAGRWMGVGP